MVRVVRWLLIVGILLPLPRAIDAAFGGGTGHIFIAVDVPAWVEALSGFVRSASCVWFWWLLR